MAENAKRHTLVFGDRFPFLYLVKNYGLSYYAAFPGCSSETEPSAATIAFLTDEVEHEQIPVVFRLEMSNGKVAEAIAGGDGNQNRGASLLPYPDQRRDGAGRDLPVFDETKPGAAGQGSQRMKG